MTSKERLLNRLAGKPVDRIPNLNIVMLFAAKYANIPYGKFCSDYRYLVEAQTKTAEDFGIDILSAMSDPYRETSDYGVRVRFQEDDLPICDEVFLGDISDFSKLKRWNPLESTRMLDRIKAIELFKHNSGDRYPILGWVEGPWAEFTDLATVSEGMLMLYDEPERVSAAMELITAQAVECAKAQIAAGADFIGIGDAAASLIGPDIYREYVKPLEQRLIAEIHQAGGRTKLHICGNITHLLPDMIELGSDIVDIDYMVDFEGAMKLAQGKCSICGHINPTEVILQGTVDEVKRWTRFCAERSGLTGIVSGGCEVPKNTPPENLKAVAEELRALGEPLK